MHACTIIAKNYLPYARVLAESFAENHPGEKFTVLILDASDDLEESFEIVSPFDIGIEPDEVYRMAMIYDLKELATAVKPWLLRTLLGRGAETATYFDPDIEIYEPLHDLDTLAERHSIVLTPHMTEPLPDDGCLPDERMIMHAGIYNLGFIATSPDATSFLEWWSSRLSRNCIIALDKALFVDQRWVDFVPSLYRHHIFTDRGCNVAYWNLHSRKLRRNGDRYEVDGVPLRFFHFSGYKPNTPHILTHHAGDRPRILLSENPDLARLCDEYGRKVIAHGFGASEYGAYIYDRLPNGLEIDSRMRRLYRDELIDSERDGGSPLPDPFDPDTINRFMEWLREPVRKSRKAPISRYLYALYRERPDLQQAFPDVFGADAPRFLQWIREEGQAQVGIPNELLENGRKSRGRARASSLEPAEAADTAVAKLAVVVAKDPRPGINLVGYLKAELGVGEVARKLMTGIEQAGIDFSTIKYDRTLSRQEHEIEERLQQQAPFDMNVICINADQLPVFRHDIGADFFAQRHTVGVWFWEISKFPAAFNPAFDLVDEIWVASKFVRDTLTRTTSKPVNIVPLPLAPPLVERMPRESFGLPEGFMFLFSFDFLSIFERKNPLGLIEAFSRAFSEGEGPILVIKSINGEHDLESLERLRLAVGARSDVYLLEDYLSPEMKSSLTASCDCYVSLHRSEGFGLTMAEAMALAKPVIATDYSGNVDFMNEQNSYPIAYELVKIPQGCDPYPAGAEWADPDLDAAAAAMKRLFEDPAAARVLGAAARDDVLKRFSVERTAQFIMERFESRSLPEPSDSGDGEEAIAELERRLLRGTATDLVRAKRRRPGIRGIRGLLRKLLWPYLQSQQELDAALGKVIVNTRQEMIASLRNVESSLRNLEAGLGRLAKDVSGSLNDARDRILRLETELTAEPYMTDPEALRTTDEAGRSIIGYDRSSEGVGGAYRDFEDTFRGSEDLIRERLRPYLELIGDHRPVLDVGCGRGEFLELLAEAGVPAHGIDLDSSMVARAKEKGLSVEEAEANAYLSQQRDGSLGAIFSAQLIEHLPYESLLEFFHLGRKKLAPGGVFIAETVNPHSIQAYKAFWVDLTHRLPIFPEVAVTFARMHGFESAYVFFPLGSGDLEKDRPTQGEYAIVAKRAI